MEFKCDTTDFKKLEEELIQNIDCEGICYNGNKWIKEDYCILKSVIREKIEELEKEVEDYQCEKNKINLYQRKVLTELLEE